jgi:hypothetical protein
MNEKTEQLVRELAEKLGTTVDHLWEVLVRQATVSAITDTITLAVFGAVLGVAAWRIVKELKKDYVPEPAIFGGFIVGLLSLVWFIFLMSSVSGIAAGFFNPEYWALKQLLQ